MPSPDLDLVRRLPARWETKVGEDFIDENGHMNIRFYLEVTALAADQVVREIGIDDAYRAERRMGVFTAEHHLVYLAEMRLGTVMTAHPQVLARSDKTVHMMVYLVDVTNERLANTLELILVHVDMDARRPTAMPEDIAAGFDGFITDHAAVGITPPLCGAMGIRQ